MQRREFMILLGGAAAGRPPSAEAQQAGKVYRVGLILTTASVSDMAGPDPLNPSMRALIHGLRDLGYVEGRNLVLERRSAEGRFERYGEIAAELVRLGVDVIVTGDNTTVKEVKRASNTVPIVMGASADPVGAGIVASLARPGGNVTGFTLNSGPEFETKRMQLLMEALPGVTSVAFLGLKSDWESLGGRSIRAAASMLGVTLIPAECTPTNYADAFALITRDRPHSLFVARSTSNYANRQIIADFAAEQRIPAIYPVRDYVEAGGLMSYGDSISERYRLAAGYVDKILKGAKPADLAVQQPNKYELVLNTKTAKALGITISPILLAQVDELVE